MLRKGGALGALIVATLSLNPACTFKTAGEPDTASEPDTTTGETDTATGSVSSEPSAPATQTGGRSGNTPTRSGAAGAGGNSASTSGGEGGEAASCSGCASGVCDEQHNCKHCVSDSECAAGNVCSAGECAAPCSADQEGESADCRSELTCCSLRCSDLKVDNRNCGACGHACGDAQFCGLGPAGCAETGQGGAGGSASGSCVECHDTTLANICAVSKLIVILDTNKNASDGNRVPGRALGAALAAQCPTQPLLEEAEQDSVEALNLTTGRPVSIGGELLVVAGGPFFQNLEGYLEQQRISPLYWKQTGEVTEFRKSATDQVVASLPIAGDHDSRDIFIIQFMRDPASGSLALNAQGFWLSGTVAATYQLTHGVLAELGGQNKAWYAYEWTDQDGDKAPDLNEIELLDSGE